VCHSDVVSCCTNLVGRRAGQTCQERLLYVLQGTQKCATNRPKYVPKERCKCAKREVQMCQKRPVRHGDVVSRCWDAAGRTARAGIGPDLSPWCTGCCPICVAVCYGVWRCVRVCCSAVQCVAFTHAICRLRSKSKPLVHGLLPCMCCSVLQCVAACCGVL